MHDFEAMPTLETARLCLRELRLEDAEDVFAYASDPLVSRYTAWEAHTSLDASRAFIHGVVHHHQRNHIFTWGLVFKDNGRLIGTCGLAETHRRDLRAELGYVLARPYWGHGLMTEATRTIIHFGFARLHFNRIEARCLMANAASARVMAKAGLSFEGVLRQHMFCKGAFQDMKLYAILREDWEKSGR